jgi:hypothetical protein
MDLAIFSIGFKFHPIFESLKHWRHDLSHAHFDLKGGDLEFLLKSLTDGNGLRSSSLHLDRLSDVVGSAYDLGIVNDQSNLSLSEANKGDISGVFHISR